ncbi:MAG: uracil-DNA glycosylase [Acidobacteriota bacterium]
MKIDLPSSWLKVIGEEFEKDYFKRLEAFVDGERKKHPGKVFPIDDEVFTAFKLTPFNKVNVLLIGQDPYPGIQKKANGERVGEAHGLCFSVKPELRSPDSLRNIFKELQSDLGCKIPNNGYLAPWAKQGMLMLNTVLTVGPKVAGGNPVPFSHRGQGWETFTDEVIRQVSAKKTPVVFVLWGNPAKAKKKLIDLARHQVVERSHPTTMSFFKDFSGTKPFSEINAKLIKHGYDPIDWQIPDV